MKSEKIVASLVLCVTLLTGCFTTLPGSSNLSNILVLQDEQATIPAADPAPTTTSTIQPTSTASPTAVVLPSSTPLPPKVYEEQRQKLRLLMEDYGLVEEAYLTDTYWDRLFERIELYGTAERIAAFELHGNQYDMYNSAYAMTPPVFYEQVNTMMERHYHFVTIHELRGFLEGWLDLPKRSIILTTDSGSGSGKSFKSIIQQFTELEQAHGYKPHLQSYICTYAMNAEESPRCAENACWNVFINAKETGFFTFGTHSQSHADLRIQTREFLLTDLSRSKNEIREHLGLTISGITWPFEACSWDLQALKELGISFGFGGFCRSGDDLFVHQADRAATCLPRIFPPNPGGYSSRPIGYTLEKILESQEK